MKRFDIIALGEALIDFTDVGLNEAGIRLFEQNPGGAPANMLTAAAHMGYQTAFIGKVGKDMHGAFLIDTLKKEAIDTSMVIEDDSVFTTLAFVQIADSGEREFSFGRKPGADTCLREDELDLEAIRNARVFHFGTLSLTDEPAASATKKAVKEAKDAGVLVSFDPNYRAPLWRSKDDAVKAVKEMLPFADAVKVSDEEAVLVTGKTDYEEAAKEILSYGPKLVAVTLGGDGVLLARKDLMTVVPGVKVDKVVDTTGAGDSFWGGFISKVLSYEKSVTELTEAELTAAAKQGNALASLVIQKKGGIPAIPTKEEVLALL